MLFGPSMTITARTALPITTQATVATMRSAAVRLKSCDE